MVPPRCFAGPPAGTALDTGNQTLHTGDQTLPFGDQTLPFGDRLHAVPTSARWDI